MLHDFQFALAPIPWAPLGGEPCTWYGLLCSTEYTSYAQVLGLGYTSYTQVLGIHRTPRSWAYIVHPGTGHTSYTQVLGIRCITQAASLGGSDNCGLNGYLRNYFVCSGGCCGQNRRCVASPPTKCGLGFVVLLTGVPGICFQHIPSCPSSLTTRRTRTASTRSILTY